MPTVYAPRGPLHQALFHLLRLAAEQVSLGTLDPAITVTAETKPLESAALDGPYQLPPPPTSWVAAIRPLEAVALHIAGTGRGLSAEELAKLFQRLSSGAAAADQGLDLFLVRQAAALWGGGVQLHSEPGCGASFTLLFASIVIR